MKNSLSVHSFESFGTVDGPGIRQVLFLYSCPLRCLYCHNPDTWLYNKNKLVEVEEVAKQLLKYKSFSKNGGVTISGGEPLMQSASLLELFKILKEQKVHTCIDTSGFIKLDDTVKELLEFTDLVLLDIKHINKQKHFKLTGVDNQLCLDFLNYLKQINKKTWIRYVLVPGYTDELDDLKKLKVFLNDFDNVEKIEVLPYHSLANDKYLKLGLNNPLIEVKEPSDEEVEFAKKILSNNKI